MSDAQYPLALVPPDVSETHNTKAEFLTAVTVSICVFYRGADKSLALPGRKQATATEDFDVHISYL